MADDETTRKADRTEHWDRQEMKIDDPGEPARAADANADADDDVARWNKAELGEERPDGTRTPLVPEDEMGEAGGLSGEGSNPGGGERWAERDTPG